MTEEKQKQDKTEEKQEIKEEMEKEKQEIKIEKKEEQEKKEVVKEEVTKEKEKKETKKKEEKIVKKKEFAVVNAKDLPISTKQAVAICNMIRYKKVGEAIILLEKVLKKKIAVPMKGEIPHRKRSHRIGKTLSGRYPEKASRFFIKMLNNLAANASVNGMDHENIIIIKAKADKASKPVKPTRIAYGRKKFKRTHVSLIAKETGEKIDGKRNKKVEEKIKEKVEEKAKDKEIKK